MTGYGPPPTYSSAPPRPATDVGQAVPVFDLIGMVLFALGWVQARGKITQAPDMPSQGSPWPTPSPYSYQARAAADLPSQPLPYVPPYPAAGPYPPRQPYPSYPPQG